jgi:hypothetical protein
MIITILVPEYILGKARNERLAAKDAAHYFHIHGSEWGEVHAYMANMGYFVLDVGDYLLEASKVDENGTEEAKPSADDPSKLHVGHTEVEPSVEKSVKDALKLESSISKKINLSRLTHRYWALTGFQLDLLFVDRVSEDESDVFDPPVPSTRELEALNRGDTLVKALALIQIIYLIAQLAARKLSGLPSAQLEIGALAFSASSMITYILYWKRPQGVESIHVIKPKRAPSQEQIKNIARDGPSYFWTKHRSGYILDKEFDLEPIPNDASQYIASSLPSIVDVVGTNNEIISLVIGALLGGTLFGGLHCLAWNFHFPTRAEGLAWRACSIVTSVLPILSVVPMGAWMRLNPRNVEPKGSRALRFILDLTLLFGFLVPYVLARLFLIVEMFRSLLFLPPKAFVETWSGSFPHWG